MRGQENAQRKLSPGLYECYDSDTYAKWKLLPQSMESFVEILRKIEDRVTNLNMKQLSTALLHR